MSTLSWSEAELPQRERTKHVHGLHPYLGKFVPQIVEHYLRQQFAPGETVYDPFAGSGTTLVEANIFGCEAVGCDISAFNALLCRVKTGRHDLDLAEEQLFELLDVRAKPRSGGSAWLRRWYAPQALRELLSYREALSLVDEDLQEVAAVILSRAARSARRVPHYELDRAVTPVTGPYRCHKHRRLCAPTATADRFLRRYTADTLRRLRAFAACAGDEAVRVVHGDSRRIALPSLLDGIITSPPYPGLIDYHDQHRYAYELLGLDNRSEEEIGCAAAGSSRAAIACYVEAMTAVFANAANSLRDDAAVIVVVNDRRRLYEQIFAQAGLAVEDEQVRRVERRTGMRGSGYSESIYLCRPLR